MLEKIYGLYEDYEAEFARLERTRRAGAGMFGLTGGPRDYPCHEQFGKKLEALLQQAEEISPEEAKEILEHLYFAPLKRSEGQDAVYWMMTAVHGMTLELIGRLSPKDAVQLRKRYQEVYPRWERLPAQKQVISALKARGRDEL